MTSCTRYAQSRSGFFSLILTTHLFSGPRFISQRPPRYLPSCLSHTRLPLVCLFRIAASIAPLSTSVHSLYLPIQHRLLLPTASSSSPLQFSNLFAAQAFIHSPVDPSVPAILLLSTFRQIRLQGRIAVRSVLPLSMVPLR